MCEYINYCNQDQITDPSILFQNVIYFYMPIGPWVGSELSEDFTKIDKNGLSQVWDVQPRL